MSPERFVKGESERTRQAPRHPCRILWADEARTHLGGGRFEAAAFRGYGKDRSGVCRKRSAQGKVEDVHGKTMERDIRLNWETITEEARRRRESRGMTQSHLTALAKVSRSTLSRFENKSGDVQLSSALRILSVLDMVDRKLEGAILLRRSTDGIVSASFAPNFGSGALEAKSLPSRDALSSFLEEIGIPEETKKRVFFQLEQESMASLPQVLLSTDRLKEYWPIQFGKQASE
jgi:transcriptional regulator with XRE-family HTH domain